MEDQVHRCGVAWSCRAPGPEAVCTHGRCAKQPDGADGLSVKDRISKIRAFPYYSIIGWLRRSRQDKASPSPSKPLSFSFFLFFLPFSISFWLASIAGSPCATIWTSTLTWDPPYTKTVISSSEADLEPKPRVSAANSEPTSSLEKSDCVVCVGQAPWPWPMSNTYLMKRVLEQL